MFRIAALICCVGLTQSACKKTKSDVLSLENFANDGKAINNLDCKGPANEYSHPSVTSLVAATDRTQATQISDQELREVYAAVPKLVREQFLATRGAKVVVKPDLSVECKYQYADSCYTKTNNDKEELENLTVYVRPNDFRGKLVRQFGFVYFQVLGRIYPRTNRPPVFWPVGSSPLMARQTLITNAFFTDMLNNPFFSYDSFKLMLENQTDAVRSAAAAKASDILEAVKIADFKKAKLHDTIAAEAFDSYFCNRQDSVNTQAIAAIAKENLSQAERVQKLSVALKSIKNSEATMYILFNNTWRVFKGFAAEILNEGTSSLSLTEEFPACAPNEGIQTLQTDGFGAAVGSESDFNYAPFFGYSSLGPADVAVANPNIFASNMINSDPLIYAGNPSTSFGLGGGRFDDVGKYCKETVQYFFGKKKPPVAEPAKLPQRPVVQQPVPVRQTVTGPTSGAQVPPKPYEPYEGYTKRLYDDPDPDVIDGTPLVPLGETMSEFKAKFIQRNTKPPKPSVENGGTTTRQYSEAEARNINNAINERIRLQKLNDSIEYGDHPTLNW